MIQENKATIEELIEHVKAMIVLMEDGQEFSDDFSIIRELAEQIKDELELL